MRKRSIIAMFACALILLIMGMISINCVEKLSHGCPFSHKVETKSSPCLRDSVTQHEETGLVALPVCTAILTAESPAFLTQGIESLHNATTDFSIETPPLRC